MVSAPDSLYICGTADGQSMEGVLAACAARRWLARYAAGVKRIRSRTERAAAACTSLITCLPALEQAELRLSGPLGPGDLGCLLEALAWCPRLLGLDLCVLDPRGDHVLVADVPAPDLSAFAKLRSLSKLTLTLSEADPFALDDIVDALVPVTGLVELRICLPRAAQVPTSLGQLKGLQSLELSKIRHCVLAPGCLDLPNLLSLDFRQCTFAHANVLPEVSALQSLTRIQFLGGAVPAFFDPQLAQLPRLAHMVYHSDACRGGGAYPWLSRLPADMGALSSSLLQIDISGQRLTQFPLALTQLQALECLRASGNEFTELPTAITALSRLTHLKLGRLVSNNDPAQVHEKRTLNVCALGDLSGFPSLIKVTFCLCEVVLCKSFLGAVRHPRLRRLAFLYAHPAPKCTLMVLQLSQLLEDLGRVRVLRVADIGANMVDVALQDAQGQAPFQMFSAALGACGL